MKLTVPSAETCRFLFTLLILICILRTSPGFSQIDISKIRSEINCLTSDSLIDAYWKRLDSCDQEVRTFSLPVLQTENLIKSICFFQKFGFSDRNRFETKSLSYNQAEMHAQYIWMHSGYMDLNIYTFPLIVECNKYYKEDYSYLAQNITVCRINQYPELIQKAIKNAENNSFKKLDMNVITHLANELKELKELTLKSENIIGIWKLGKFDVQINVLDNGNCFFDCDGFIYKLIRHNKTVFHFATNIDGSYLEILENGNLVNKDENGNVLEVYEKKT